MSIVLLGTAFLKVGIGLAWCAPRLSGSALTGSRVRQLCNEHEQRRCAVQMCSNKLQSQFFLLQLQCCTVGFAKWCFTCICEVSPKHAAAVFQKLQVQEQQTASAVFIVQQHRAPCRTDECTTRATGTCFERCRAHTARSCLFRLQCDGSAPPPGYSTQFYIKTFEIGKRKPWCRQPWFI